MKITWRCPHCMKRNKWVWEEDNLIVGAITMHCAHCARKTRMYQDRAANFAAIEDIKEDIPHDDDLLTVPEAKRFLEGHGFIVKNAVTFTSHG